MCDLIDTEPLVYRRLGDLHLFTAAPPSSTLSFSFLSPLPPSTPPPQSLAATVLAVFGVSA